MKPLRHLALALVVLGLVVLEIAHGVYRVRTNRDRERARILETMERAQADLAEGSRGLLTSGREHALYLARSADVRRLATEGEETGGAVAEAAREEAGRRLLPYVVSFSAIDAVRVLDAGGRERFRACRIGGGVGALPRAQLDPAPDEAAVAAARSLGPGEVALSGITLDAERVEVPPGERQVLHHVARIGTGQDGAGLLVLTVYAAPVLGAVRAFRPVEGAVSCLVGEAGEYVAHSDRARETGNVPGAIFADHDALPRDALKTGGRLALHGDVWLVRRVSDSPPWILVTRVPVAALDRAAGSAGQVTPIVTTVVVTLLLGAFGLYLLGLSRREIRAREEARFLAEKQRLEDRVRTAERLGALGLLTAGVAHEINNPLEGIGNYLALAERETTPAARRVRYLAAIREGFERIRSIVKELTAFARPDMKSGVADLAEIVARARALAGWGEDAAAVEVRTEGLGPGLRVAGDSGRLEQVFVNLFLNAARAMGGRGVIMVAAARREGGRTVEIHVEDSGPGIAAEDLGRVFDPFFTRSGGTGLGLSVSYGIVAAHGGTIAAGNRETGGARFTIVLPLAGAEGATPEGPGEGARTGPRAGAGHEC